ncbi:hypothetical protein [Pseudozobellia sp. WGM2]|uniref:hypothetical protein n=1 Tax=Pseudozobellia sp. WGM2 TaxID=2787625 RepID=UPI001AE01307|nr:hypothetical protein [Pseudozobellia sp. WGM2]
MDNTLYDWSINILRKLNQDWSSVPEPILSGYTIFYSPIKFKPTILIIGDNPGGTESIRQKELPAEHEYFKYDYHLARIMRNKIFKGERLNALLKNSVKTNRIFFKTKNLDEFNKLVDSKNMEAYCFNILDEIIFKLQPKLIFAESLGTFRKLSSKETVLLKKESGKSLLVQGIHNDITVLGINHPSRASYHKIDDNDWNKVNDKLNEIL